MFYVHKVIVYFPIIHCKIPNSSEKTNQQQEKHAHTYK